jgi:hypothetical protein
VDLTVFFRVGRCKYLVAVLYIHISYIYTVYIYMCVRVFQYILNAYLKKSIRI